MRVPGVTIRTTARLTGALPPRFFASAGIFDLLADGDAEALADEAGEIGLGGVHRHAAHRDILALVLAALGEVMSSAAAAGTASSKNSS